LVDPSKCIRIVYSNSLGLKLTANAYFAGNSGQIVVGWYITSGASNFIKTFTCSSDIG